MNKSRSRSTKVYRSGKPRVTETLEKHWSERGTGHGGTGIYAYGSKERATRNKNQPSFEIDVTGKKLFEPWKIGRERLFGDGNRDLKKLSEAMNDLAWAGVYKRDKWAGKDKKTLEGDIRYHAEELGFTGEEALDAVKKSVGEYRERGAGDASQPINHLLLARGYAGVDPGPGLRDDNSVGIVVFREALGIKAGEEENVDVGRRISGRKK